MANRTVRCETVEGLRHTYWFAVGSSEVVGRSDACGFHDLRKPPFVQILPCPYCGVETDEEHRATMNQVDGHVFRKP